MKDEGNKKYKYLSLTPKELSANDVNVVALKEKVIDKEIKNIAIMAPYGAGKSSVLRTFEKEYGKKKCINVSLASFNIDDYIYDKSVADGENNNSDDQMVNDINNQIEKSILQQILYKKEKKDLPKSKIKRIGRPSFWHSFFIFIFILLGVLAIGSGTLLTLQISGKSLFKISNQIYFITAIVSALICIAGLVLSQRISKVSYGDLDVEFKEEEMPSLLNKFLNEIIYYFQKTNYDTVIFEDLDRFNNLAIFVKLRELNTLLNNNDKIAKKHKITFLYAINNAMFKHHKERTKFFDFILPLLPVLSPLNVKDDLVASLKESGLGADWLPSDFIYDISQYIKDKRVLNSIINDCITMLNNLDLAKIPGNNLTQKQVQLFALMSYKNICPQEFADLEDEKGELINAIACARILAQEQVNLIDERIAEKQTQIQRSEETAVKTLNQIRLMIKGSIATKNSGSTNSTFIVDKIEYIPEDRDTVLACTLMGYVRGSRISEIENGLGINSLKQFWDDVRIKETGEINKYKEEIQKLSKEKASLTEDGFACLLKYSEQVFSQTNPTALLHMLVVNRYITEHYRDFMGRSSEEFLSNNDRAFIRLVVENHEPNFELLLTSPQIILRDLSDEKYERNAMLNRSIINTFFDDHDISTIKRQRFYDLLLSNTDTVNYCIVKYFVHSENWNKNFVEFLVDNRTDFYDLLQSTSLDKNMLKGILKYILDSVKASALHKQSDNKIYQEILSDDVPVLSLIADDEAKLNFFKQLQFRFDSICNCLDKSLLKQIEQYNLWTINAANLQHLIKNIYEIADKNALGKGWTLVKNLSIDTANYINQNLPSYITEIILQESQIEMDEEDIIIWLENNALDLEMRKEICGKITTSIAYNSNLNLEIVKALLAANKIILSCEEMVKLLEKDASLDKLLCDYLYHHRETISLQFQSFEPLAYLIANCHKKYVSDNSEITLYDIYRDNLNNFNWEIIKLDNDEIIHQIVINSSSFSWDSIKHIINGNYPKSLIPLVQGVYDHIVANSLINYKVALCYFLYGDDKVKKSSSTLMQHLLPVDSIDDARKIFAQTVNENIQLTKELIERLISLGIDSADIFLSQIEYLSKEEALSWAKDINPLLEPLEREGSLNGTSELNDDPVVRALYKMNYARRVGNGLLRYKIKVI